MLRLACLSMSWRSAIPLILETRSELVECWLDGSHVPEVLLEEFEFEGMCFTAEGVRLAADPPAVGPHQRVDLSDDGSDDGALEEVAALPWFLADAVGMAMDLAEPLAGP